MGTTSTTATTAKKPAAEKFKCIGVTARPDSFRRGGHSFSQEEKVIELAALDTEQRKQIRGEKKLVVRDVSTTADKIHVRAAVK